MTDIKNENGRVCFDAECSLCANLARRVGPFLRRHRFGLAPLQTEWVKDRLATVFRYRARNDGLTLGDCLRMCSSGRERLIGCRSVFHAGLVPSSFQRRGGHHRCSHRAGVADWSSDLQRTPARPPPVGSGQVIQRPRALSAQLASKPDLLGRNTALLNAVQQMVGQGRGWCHVSQGG